MAMPVSPFRELKDGKLILNYHPGQVRVDDSQARFVVMQAGTQSGKTCFGVHWLYDEMRRCGVGDYLAITATFPLLKLKMLPEFLEVFDKILRLGNWRESEKVYLMKNRSRVIFGSATNPESIESATAKAAWLDEAGQHQFRREAWEAVQRRLSIHQGRVLITTSLYGLGWLKTELYDRWKSGDKQIEVIQFDSSMNPVFPKEEFERMQGMLPRWKFNMFYRGQYDRPSGLIYDCFDERSCVVGRFPIPENWPIYVGHDFGGSNPAGVFYAQDPATGYFYLWHEYLPGGVGVAEQVAHFKEITKGKNVVKRVGGSHQEKGWRGDYSSHGWVISESRVKDVEVGISRVYGLHKLNKVFVFNDLFNYLDEKLSYSRQLDENFQPTEKIENKERYHLMDAERYILSDFAPETAVVRKASPVWTF